MAEQGHEISMEEEEKVKSNGDRNTDKVNIIINSKNEKNIQSNSNHKYDRQ